MERLAVAELLVVSLIALACIAVVAWPAARICRRAGFTPWLGVIALIPLFNLALLWFMAIAPWPASEPRR